MERKIKRQKIKAGAVVKIDISERRSVFGRLFSPNIGIYDFVLSQNDPAPSLEEIIHNRIFLHCSIYDSIITKGVFEIIGWIPLSVEEISNIPPKFHQELDNYKDCTIYWADGRERKALPAECIGLERSTVWGPKELVERIEDYFAGRKNFYVEYDKVILSEEDPRFKAGGAGPHLKWDFDKREFYYVD